jgi:glycosyltransferase involved in cell wall biosynthesis
MNAEKKKPYIICLVGQLGNGGTEKQLYLFLKYLDREKYSPLVVVSSNPDGCWKDPIEKELKIRIISLGTLPRPIKFIKFGFIVMKLKPEAVISWSFYTNIFSSIPGIKHFIGSLRGDLDESKNKLSQFHCEKSVKADCFIVNSSKLAKQLESEKIPENKISVIYNIYEKNPLFANEGERKKIADNLKVKYNLPEDKVIVTTIARNTPEKDIPFLIDVIEKASAVRNDFHVFFIGNGGPAYENEIRKRGLEDFFTLAGEVKNAAELLPVADIYCLSSKTEGMPNVVLEALDARCAVLTTEVGGIEDIFSDVDEALREKMIIKERDISDGALKLLALIDDSELRGRISAQAEKGLFKFSPEKITADYMEVLRGIE